LRIAGPAAVRMVTLRITVARIAKGRYVLGNGSALGAESAPAPFAPARDGDSRRPVSTAGAPTEPAGWDGVGELCVVRVPDEQAARIAIDTTAANKERM
jgi:hypothetical protein